MMDNLGAETLIPPLALLIAMRYILNMKLDNRGDLEIRNGQSS